MSNNTTRWFAALMTLLAVLQIWTLVRQYHLEGRVNPLSGRLSEVQIEMSRLRNELDSIQGRLSQMAEADRWLSRPQVAATPGLSCDQAGVAISWQLREWSAGTTAALQYRSGAEQPWQAAQVEQLGQQGYTARFTLDVQQQLHPEVAVIYHDEGNSQAARVSEGTVSEPPDRNYQYRILVQSPELNRSTDVERLELGNVLWRPLQIKVRTREGGQYEIDARVPDPQESPCFQVTQVLARAYAGQQLVETIPLQELERWTAGWQSDRDLTRLELQVELADHSSSVVTVDLTQ